MMLINSVLQCTCHDHHSPSTFVPLAPSIIYMYAQAYAIYQAALVDSLP